MELKPWMPASTPAEILLHDAMHDCGITGRQLEGCAEHHVLACMQNARVVTELHVVAINNSSLALLGKYFRRFKNVRYEHRALTFWLRLKKMKVLPNCPTNRAWNTDVMLEA